jgi:dihydrofolate reductase
MRKLILQMQTSLDGFVSTGPNDEQSWVTWALKEIESEVIDLADSSDTIILGRKLAVDYIPFWDETVKNPDHEMYEMAKRIVAAKKIIFTKTLDKSVWANTELAKGNLRDEIMALKNQKGKDIMVYGGSGFVSALIKEGLIDEYHFFINPVVLGKGVPVFDQIESFRQLKLKKSITYNCGIVKLMYEPK